MSNVLVEKNKLDVLATAISNKSGEPLKLTLDEMVSAVDGIETPTGNIDITQAGVTDVTNYATATVPDNAVIDNGINGSFITVGGARKWTASAWFEYLQNGIVNGGINYASKNIRYNAVASGTTITPTTSAQTIGGANYMMEGAVTVNPIPSQYIVPSGTKSITANGTGIDVTSYASVDVAVPTGADIPIFTINVTTSPITVTCNKTYTECYSLYNTGVVGALAEVVTPNSTLNMTMGVYLALNNAYMLFAIFNEHGVPVADVTYLANNTCSYSEPSGLAIEAGTPTATKGTVSNHSISVTPSVTNNTGYITGSTKTGTAVTVSASELVSGTLNVTSAGTKDVTNYASASIPSGTEGTPTATKGTVSNHSVSVTPSVTNTSGFISGGTKNGTAVTVSASELVSGFETKTENGTYDVTNLAEIVVDVQGGGGSTINVGKTTKTLATASNSIQFTGLSGNPTSFVVTSSADITANTNGVTAVVFDGTSLHGQILSTQATADTGFTKSYSGGTLTITATTGSFQANEYKLAYTYGGSTSDIETADVQVGSGATSITFSVTGRPVYWSCIFKSDFSTSSGYQRVIEVANDGTSTYGICLDSSAHASTTYWTASYSGGNLTITSQGTNAGGYFHQPGYYQLTYAVDESAPSYQSKTVTPTTSQQVVTADSGYDALSQVTVNAMPSMTLPSSTSATSSGTSKATISASSSTQYLNIPTGYNATAQYYTISASGGGGASVTTKTVTNSSASNVSISFTGLSGAPIAFAVKCNAQLTRSSNSSYYYVTTITYDGTNHHGNYWRMSNGTYYNDTTHYSHTYSNGTLTVTSSGSRSAAGGSFYNGTYELVYIY